MYFMHFHFRSDVKNVIRDAWESVPFYLTSPTSEESKVLVTDPKSAKYLQDELTTTYDRFEQNKSGIFQRGIDRISGEVSKGYQESEKMLLKGAHIVGMGKLILENGLIKLRSPTEGQVYILTRSSRDEIIQSLTNTSKILKVFTDIFSAITISLSAYLIYRLVRKLLRYYRNRQMADELRRTQEQRMAERAARARNSNTTPTDQSDDSNTCVVCLENPREVVLLDCGHICICADCALALPEPKKCPVCRQSVARFVATYTPWHASSFS